MVDSAKVIIICSNIFACSNANNASDCSRRLMRVRICASPGHFRIPTRVAVVDILYLDYALRGVESRVHVERIYSVLSSRSLSLTRRRLKGRCYY